jgi:hypothetical protein
MGDAGFVSHVDDCDSGCVQFCQDFIQMISDKREHAVDPELLQAIGENSGTSGHAPMLFVRVRYIYRSE